MSRKSLGGTIIPEGGMWRSVIRIFAITMAILGLILIFNEILENVYCTEDRCKIHLAEMLWGITLLSFGLLILQKGDVTTSMKELAATGDIVRSWWPGRRAADPKGTIVVEQEKGKAAVTTITDPTGLPPVQPPKPDEGG